jgi:hypothetical protein
MQPTEPVDLILVFPADFVVFVARGDFVFL